MTALIRSATLVGLAAMGVSVPLVFVVVADLHGAVTMQSRLLYASPVMIAMMAAVLFLGLASALPQLWARFPAIVGAISGVLTFGIAVAAFACAVSPGDGPWPAATIAAFVGFGLLVFGWIPVLLGGGAAWLGHRLYTAPQPDLDRAGAWWR